MREGVGGWGFRCAQVGRYLLTPNARHSHTWRFLAKQTSYPWYWGSGKQPLFSKSVW